VEFKLTHYFTGWRIALPLSCKLKKRGSAWGPVTLPVFKTGESQLRWLW